MTIDPVRYYGANGSLFPYDLRHLAADPAFCDLRPDGSVWLRLHTEPGFAEANLIYRDGDYKAAPMQLWGETARFQFWQMQLQPESAAIQYAFALRREDGTIVYFGPSGVTFGLEFFYKLDRAARRPFSTPAWSQGALVYQIFPERFANGEPANDPPGAVTWGTPPTSHQFQGGDLQGVTQHLDYLQELGIELIYLNPIFTSPSTHKYDTSDYMQVDPAFGGNQAFKELVQAAHRRGMRVIIDASFNHCHPSFFAFQDIIEKGRESQYWDWFTIYEHPLRVKTRPHKVREHWAKDESRLRAIVERFHQETGIPIEIAADDGPVLEPSYEAWFNVLTMPKINLDNPATRQYFLEVAAYWVREFEIDGWRMDVVPHVTDEFWIDFRNVVKAVNPEAYLISEVWGNTSFWLQGDRFDATMDYTFRYLCLDYFAQASMETAEFTDGLKQALMMYSQAVTLSNQHLLSSHDTARFMHFAGEDIQRLRLATFLQMTFPGAPGVYYGDEIGMTGGHDPDCRRPFPWGQSERWDTATLEHFKSLIALRQQYPALRLGDWQLAWQGVEGLAYLRSMPGERSLLMVLARQEALQDVRIAYPGQGLERVWGQAGWQAQAGVLKLEQLAPWSGVIFTIA